MLAFSLRCRIAFVFFLAVALTGCAETRSFTVEVVNETRRPLTIGLVKEGGPYERQWASPEDAAMDVGGNTEWAWDSIVVPPGKTGGLKEPVSGKFDSGSHAVLRVYAGDLRLSEILAMSRGSMGRLDLPLYPGPNAFRVTERERRLQAQPIEPAAE